MKKTLWYIIAILAFPVTQIFGQSPVVSIQLKNDSLKIGEQTVLILNLSADKKSKVVFPIVKDTLTSQIEIIEQSGIDSIFNANGIDYSQKIYVTAFDSGVFVIPAFKFLVQNQKGVDSIFSTPLSIYFQDVQVDTAKPAKAIKTVRDIPEPPGDYNWLWWLLLLIPIAAGLYYWFKVRKPKPKVTIESVIEIPAHQKALGSLQDLENEKLWQKGFYKKYHSRLSEIIRIYLEERYKVPALEKTTAEISLMIRNSKLVSISEYESLMQLLQLADMVKFARYNPIGSENEMSFKNATSFVEQTKPLTQNSTDKHEGNGI